MPLSKKKLKTIPKGDNILEEEYSTMSAFLRIASQILTWGQPTREEKKRIKLEIIKKKKLLKNTSTKYGKV